MFIWRWIWQKFWTELAVLIKQGTGTGRCPTVVTLVYRMAFVCFSICRLITAVANTTASVASNGNTVKKKRIGKGELQITGILDKIDEYRRNRLQHLQKMPQNRIALKSYHYRPQGTRTTLERAVVTLETERIKGPILDDDDVDDDDDNDDEMAWKEAVLVRFNKLFRCLCGELTKTTKISVNLTDVSCCSTVLCTCIWFRNSWLIGRCANYLISRLMRPICYGELTAKSPCLLTVA